MWCSRCWPVAEYATLESTAIRYRCKDWTIQGWAKRRGEMRLVELFNSGGRTVTTKTPHGWDRVWRWGAVVTRRET